MPTDIKESDLHLMLATLATCHNGQGGKVKGRKAKKRGRTCRDIKIFFSTRSEKHDGVAGSRLPGNQAEKKS